MWPPKGVLKNPVGKALEASLQVAWLVSIQCHQHVGQKVQYLKWDPRLLTSQSPRESIEIKSVK
jgi:hypothetical protein